MRAIRLAAALPALTFSRVERGGFQIKESIMLCVSCGEAAPPTVVGLSPYCARCRPVLCPCGKICEATYRLYGRCEDCQTSQFLRDMHLLGADK